MIENEVLVTIGIPVYNVALFIEHTLKSVLNQSYTNFELIITDDGSADNTVEVIRSFNDPRITLIVDDENHGISYRLNQQIDLAKGKYFVRMDGDDLMFPDRVEKQVRYLEEHPDVDVVGAGAVIINNENQIIGMRINKINCKKPIDAIKTIPFIHPTVTGKIEFFRRHKYDEELSGVEDKDLWCRGVVDSVYDMMSEPLLFYRDPLKFKLNTYLNRKQKGRKQVILRWNMFDNKMPAIKYIIDSYIKSVGACVLSKLGTESRFIANRNVKSDEASKYYSILQNL